MQKKRGHAERRRCPHPGNPGKVHCRGSEREALARARQRAGSKREGRVRPTNVGKGVGRKRVKRGRAGGPRSVCRFMPGSNR